jgi:hypothetical protein
LLESRELPAALWLLPLDDAMSSLREAAQARRGQRERANAHRHLRAQRARRLRLLGQRALEILVTEQAQAEPVQERLAQLG